MKASDYVKRAFSLIDVNTKVFFLYDGNIVEGVVDSITLKIDADGEVRTEYFVEAPRRTYSFLEGRMRDEVFLSKEDCVEAFLNKLGVKAKITLTVE